MDFLLIKEAELQQLELSAVAALSRMTPTWHGEAGLQGVLRSLDATVAQRYAISDNQEAGDGSDPIAARQAICEQMQTICAPVLILAAL